MIGLIPHPISAEDSDTPHAWLACAALAHNIVRWTARLGRTQNPRKLTAAATVRNRLLTVPGRLVNHAGQHILRLPARWPRCRAVPDHQRAFGLRLPARWPRAHTFTAALKHLRNLPQLI